MNQFYIITPNTPWGNKKTAAQELRERQDQEELFARLLCESWREQQHNLSTPTVGGIPGPIITSSNPPTPPSPDDFLSLWLDAGYGCTQVDSASIDTWTDRSNGIVFKQPVASKQPLYSASVINGYPTIVSTPTSWMTSEGSSTPTYNDFTIFLVYKTLNSSKSWFTKANNNVNQEYYIFNNSSQINIGNCFNGAGISNGIQPTIAAEVFSPYAEYNKYHIACITKQGLHCHFMANGSGSKIPSSGPMATTLSPLNGPYTLFGVYSGSEVVGTGFHLAEMKIYNKRLDFSDLQTVYQSLHTKYNLGSSSMTPIVDRKGIYFRGDSMTAGIGVTTANIYCNSASANLGRSVWDYCIDGMSYQQASEMVQSESVEITPYLQPNDAVVLWAGTNDVYYGQSAAQITNSIQTFCQNVKNVGYNNKIAVINIINRAQFSASMGASTGSITIGIQKGVNDFLSSSIPGSWADIYIPAQEQPELQDALAALTGSTTYFQSGGTHLTNAGQAIVARLVITASAGF